MKRWPTIAVLFTALGCGGGNDTIDDPQIFSCSQGKFEGVGELPDDLGGLPYATEVVDVVFGDNAGFGQEEFPEVVLGVPDGRDVLSGSRDVLSLGVGGEIVLAFGDRAIIDGPGVDFIVFENSFWPNGVSSSVFAELAEVSVSEVGETWVSFPCSASSKGPPWPGCAGWQPALSYDAIEVLPIDASLTGGDGFDLADLGLSSARFVRIVDISDDGAGDNAGFDLDAVALVHCENR